MVSLIIPAYREAERIGRTLAGVRRGIEALSESVEVIVVDDGSDDGTGEAFRRSGVQVFRCSGETDLSAPEHLKTRTPEHLNTRTPERRALRLIRLERNQGKGAALARGLAEARGEWIVMLDADLGETAAQFHCLLEPVRAGDADMTIAVFPDARRQATGDRRQATGDSKGGASKGPRWGWLSSTEGDAALPDESVDCRLPPAVSRGGFGLALRTARWGVARLTGRVLQAPLSGQRAFAAAHLPLFMPLEPGFGLEVGLDIDALRAGLRVLEVPTTMAHAGTGRNWAGFRHRGRQLAHILRALARRAASGGTSGEIAKTRKNENAKSN